jgi:hypothetical protein
MNGTTEDRSSFRMGRDGLEAEVNLLEERGAESRLLNVVVLRCLVQFSFGKSVKFAKIHSFQLGSSIPKYVSGRAPRTRSRVPVSIATVSLLRPEPLILLSRQGFKALKEPLG